MDTEEDRAQAGFLNTSEKKKKLRRNGGKSWQAFLQDDSIAKGFSSLSFFFSLSLYCSP